MLNLNPPGVLVTCVRTWPDAVDPRTENHARPTHWLTYRCARTCGCCSSSRSTCRHTINLLLDALLLLDYCGHKAQNASPKSPGWDWGEEAGSTNGRRSVHRWS
ncbi:hypothetical protein BRADI_2g51123v3 [Brachypodium distachyon]|uniref:Uncharacterized protein n=1 Tax=Brachypodium distachyon TaxID=15368 RepID=A0A0Q3R9Z1_BRADI|nr:hypothetical protein BRADI_2g51123v3 [Brachypodium distachyon]